MNSQDGGNEGKARTNDQIAWDVMVAMRSSSSERESLMKIIEVLTAKDKEREEAPVSQSIIDCVAKLQEDKFRLEAQVKELRSECVASFDTNTNLHNERASLLSQVSRLTELLRRSEEALKGVIAVADRKTDEFDFAKETLTAIQSELKGRP